MDMYCGLPSQLASFQLHLVKRNSEKVIQGRKAEMGELNNPLLCGC